MGGHFRAAKEGARQSATPAAERRRQTSPAAELPDGRPDPPRPRDPQALFSPKSAAHTGTFAWPERTPREKKQIRGAARPMAERIPTGGDWLRAEKENRSGYLREAFQLSGLWAIELADRHKKERKKFSDYLRRNGVPLLRDGMVVGTFSLTRNHVEPFTERQIEVIRTFADQAAIAIENTRLLSELRESLRQQTATADVLKVISRSTFDLQTVLNTLVESAGRLCAADNGVIFQRDGDLYRLAANLWVFA
jgi:hypothetical protein